MQKDIHDSPHYHEEAKGCKLREYKIFTHTHRDKWGNDLDNFIIKAECLTHKIIICRCGWEFGWHLGVYLKTNRDFINQRNTYEVTRS